MRGLKRVDVTSHLSNLRGWNGVKKTLCRTAKDRVSLSRKIAAKNCECGADRNGLAISSCLPDAKFHSFDISTMDSRMQRNVSFSIVEGDHFFSGATQRFTPGEENFHGFGWGVLSSIMDGIVAVIARFSWTCPKIGNLQKIIRFWSQMVSELFWFFAKTST